MATASRGHGSKRIPWMDAHDWQWGETAARDHTRGSAVSRIFSPRGTGAEIGLVG